MFYHFRIPMLPQKSVRPKLLDLMKLHIHGIEKQNQENPFLNLDIDWVLDELGLVELKGSPRIHQNRDLD